jgi:hypothetical protein
LTGVARGRSIVSTHRELAALAVAEKRPWLGLRTVQQWIAADRVTLRRNRYLGQGSLN